MKCNFCNKQARYMSIIGYLCVEHYKEKIERPKDHAAVEIFKHAATTHYTDEEEKS